VNDKEITEVVMNRIKAAIVTVLIFAPAATVQWEKRQDGSIAWTRDGRPNLSAAAPKARDGKPDLSGVWLPEPDPMGKPGEGVESSLDFVIRGTSST
jgi:hypothetical protein